jgi:hypothetical protein
MRSRVPARESPRSGPGDRHVQRWFKGAPEQVFVAPSAGARERIGRRRRSPSRVIAITQRSDRGQYGMLPADVIEMNGVLPATA